jgi:guanylate kinase
MSGNNLGSLFIVAAPSGGGKTSLVKKLIHDLALIDVSISHTTRAMRPGEVNGVDYFFINEAEFENMVIQNAFIEHAVVFDHLYGTAFEQINARLSAGVDVVLDIDWQGAQQIKRSFSDAVSVFVIPPSIDALKERLQARRQDNEIVIQSRMNNACTELQHYPEFDYLIVNDDFEEAAFQLQSIVIAHRLRMSRQSIQQEILLSFLLSSAV